MKKFIVMFTTLCLMLVMFNVSTVYGAGMFIPHYENAQTIKLGKTESDIFISDKSSIEHSRNITLKENAVLKLFVKGEKLSRFRVVIGASLTDSSTTKGKKMVSNVRYIDNYYPNDETMIELHYLLPKGEWYIWLQFTGNQSTKFDYVIEKDSTSGYDVKTTKYQVVLNGGELRKISESNGGELKEQPKSVTCLTLENDPKQGKLTNFLIFQGDPVKTGYTFTKYTVRDRDGKWLYKLSDGSYGWYNSSDKPSAATKALFLVNSQYTIANYLRDKNTTVRLYANYKANKFTIQYHANGGTGTMKDTKAVYGEANKLRTNTFKRNGYTFGGWFVKRKSDNKWLYTNGTAKKWYVAGKEPKGYKRVVYKTEASLSKITSTNGAVIGVYAKWNKNK